MKQLNEFRVREVFHLIHHQPGLFRSQIAGLTARTKGTTDRLVQVLLDQDLIREETVQGGRQGRGGIGLFVNPDNPCVIGVDLGATHLVVAGLNLQGSILVEYRTELTLEMDREEILERIDSGIGEVHSNLLRQRKHVIGIGFGDAGLVDSEYGVILNAVNLPSWKSVELVKHLKLQHELPTFLQNSSRLKCLAEAHYGVARGVSGMLFVDLGIGVGLGVLSNGRLYSGEQGRGCEFGHITIDPDGPICSCGGRGCLEALVGSRGLVRQARNSIRDGVYSILGTQADGNLESLTVQKIFKAAEQGDRLAMTLVESTILILGRALGGLCNIFNPQLIVLGGGMAKSYKLWQSIGDVIRRTALPYVAEQVRIECSCLGDSGGVLGAGELAIQHLLSIGVDKVIPKRHKTRSSPRGSETQKIEHVP